MGDPKAVILGLLRDNWGLDFTPKFSSEWYQASESLPQVTVSRISTHARRMGFTEAPSSSERGFNALLAVDVWSREDEGKRWRMIKEVDRILHGCCDSPGGGLEFVDPSGWRDLDEGDRRPQVYRSRINVEVRYYG